MSTKGCVGFFSFYLDLGVICKSLKRPGFYTLAFYTFINNSRSKQNEKNQQNAKCQQKIMNCMVVGARQNFQFFRQKAWFLGNRRDLP